MKTPGFYSSGEDPYSLTTALSDRLRRVADLRAAGKTFAEIGLILGLSGARACQLYGKIVALRKIYAGTTGDPLWGLSLRAVHACNKLGLETRDAVAEALTSGRLRPGCPRNYGWDSHVEIHVWLGLPVPIRSSGCVCPHCGHRITLK